MHENPDTMRIKTYTTELKGNNNYTSKNKRMPNVKAGIAHKTRVSREENQRQNFTFMSEKFRLIATELKCIITIY